MPIRCVNGSERGLVDEINERFVAADMRLLIITCAAGFCLLLLDIRTYMPESKALCNQYIREFVLFLCRSKVVELDKRSSEA